MAWSRSTRTSVGITTATTKHGNECTMSFGRPSKFGVCKRCDELREGAKPVVWNLPVKTAKPHLYRMDQPCPHTKDGQHEYGMCYCKHCGAGTAD